MDNEVIDEQFLSGLTRNTEQSQLIEELKKSLTEDMKKEYELLEQLCDYCKPSKSEEKEKDKPVDDVKDIGALRKFQSSPIAGSILIHHDFEKLFDILKGMTIGASLSSGGNKKEKEEKGPKKKLDFVGKLKDAGQDVLIFFKSIMQVALLAPPLLVLTPVLLLSTLALGGILKVIKKLIIPNLPNKNQSKKIEEASSGFEALGKAIKSLAKSVLIIPLIAIPLLLSIPLIPLIKVFMKGMSDVSASSAKESKSFKKSILSFGLMIASLLLLTIGIGIAAKMGVFTAPAIKAIALSAVIMVGIIALGALAGLAKWGIIAIGVTSFLMAASFLLMSVALKILFNMEKEIQLKKLIPVLASMLLIVVGMALIGVASILALLPTAVFLVFSLALAIGLAAFWLSLKLLSAVSGMMGGAQQGIDSIRQFIISFATGAGEYILGALAGVAFAIFSVALGIGLILFLVDIGLMKLIAKIGIENCDVALSMINKISIELEKIDFLKAVIVALEFAVFSVALAVGTILFLISLGAIKLINKIKDSEIDSFNSKLEKITSSFSSKDSLKSFGLALIGSIAFVAFAGSLLIGMLALWGAMEAIEKIQNTSKKLKSSGGDNYLSDAYNSSIGALIYFTTGEATDSNEITLGLLGKATKNCLGLAALAIEMAAYTVPMAAAFLALTSVFSSLEKLQSSVDKIGGKENVDKILSSVGIIFDSMATTAESFKGMSHKAITAIGSLVKDVAESIGMLADTMIKIKDGIKEEEIEGATNKIKLMCLKMFGDGETDDGTYTLTKLFKTLSNSKLKKLRADSTEALVPIINAISLLADTVLKMGDEKIFSDERVNKGISNFQKISGLFSEFTNLCTGLVARQSGSTLFSKIFGDKSPLNAIKDLVEQNFFDYVAKAVDGFNMAGEQLANLNTDGLKPVIEFFGAQSKFFGDWIANSTTFSKGMGEIGKGLGHLKQKDVETFNNFLVTLKTGGNGISVAVQSLIEFANKASDFASIAKSFSSMSDSLNKISKNKNGFLDVMKSANKNKNMESVAQVTNIGKSSDEKILEKLTNLEAILESFVPSTNLGHVQGKGIKVYVEPVSPEPTAPLNYQHLGVR